MAVIYFKDKDLDNLESICRTGREGDISIYTMPRNVSFMHNYELLRGNVIKSYKEDGSFKKYLSEKEYASYIENKHQKVLAYSKYSPSDFRFLNIPQGPIYLNKSFWASYQWLIEPSMSLAEKCYNMDSEDFIDLDLMVHFAEQIQTGFRDELHPEHFYTDDFHLCNVLVDESNNIHFIDADSFRVGKLDESSYYLNGLESSDPTYRALIQNQSKYLENGILRSSREKDIFHIYEYLIQLVTKAPIDKFLPQQIYKLLQNANFPNEFIDYFSLCFDNSVSNRFIPSEIFDKIRTDYKIDASSFVKCRSSYCRLKKK